MNENKINNGTPIVPSSNENNSQTNEPSSVTN